MARSIEIEDRDLPEAAGEEARAMPVELFFDLVFVFALTQVTAFLVGDLSWTRFAQGMLLLALLWWAWAAFTWVANASDRDATRVRSLLFAAMILSFVAALALPEAFGDRAVTFAIAYVAVRAVHVWLYVDAARRGRARWRSIAGFSTGVAIAAVLLIVGSLLDDPARSVLWAVALAADLAGPWVDRRELRGLQPVVVSHFAERFALFVIICLGESVVAIGLGVESADLDLSTIAGVALALLVSVGLWWTYFDYVAGSAEHRLATMADPVSAARDAYSYLHFLMVAGIVVFAVGAKNAVAHVGDPMEDAVRLAFCGGVALYLLGHVAFGLRMMGTVSVEKTTAAAACLVIFVATPGAAAGFVALLVVGVLAALVARESIIERELRGRLHHRLPLAR